MGKVRDSFGGMGWLRCKGWVNNVIINVITEITDVITYRYFFYISTM